MSDQNAFGGKNRRSLYVPMSEIEQEFLARLQESGDLVLHVHGWGYIAQPRLTVGDHQVVIPLEMDFNQPETPIPVSSFDLELATTGGLTLFRERQSCEYGGEPLLVGAGTHLSMVWHIGIRAIPPQVIKAFMPGVVGMTSRRFDRDTGNLTLTGNMHLSTHHQRLLRWVTGSEDAVQLEAARKLKS